MAFEYDLSTNRGKVRFEVGDSVEEEGCRPSGRNFSDAEIDYALAQESAVMLAVARLCEQLAREYAAYAGIQMLDVHKESYNNQSDKYAKRADELRRRYGTERIARSAHPTRIDGYSDDIAANEV